MSDSVQSQGDPINWFSPHQRAILADMSWTELQLLARHCRQPMTLEKDQEIERLRQENRLLKAELEVLKAMR